MLSEDVSALYLSLSSLEKYREDEIDSISCNNGIFVLFEDGEKYNGYDRIVYVGCNHTAGGLVNRLKAIFYGNKHNASIRNYLGAAILVRNKDHYLSTWSRKVYVNERKYFGRSSETNYEKIVEDKISEYLSEHFSIACIPIADKNLRITLSSHLVGTLRSVYSSSVSSYDWLGRNSIDGRIRESGMWEIGSRDQDVLSKNECTFLIDCIHGNQDTAEIIDAEQTPESTSHQKTQPKTISDPSPSEMAIVTNKPKEHSWSLTQDNRAILHLSENVVRLSGCTVSSELNSFFKLNQLLPGEVRPVKLFFNGVRACDGKLVKASILADNETEFKVRIWWDRSLRSEFERYYNANEEACLVFSVDSRNKGIYYFSLENFSSFNTSTSVDEKTEYSAEIADSEKSLPSEEDSGSSLLDNSSEDVENEIDEDQKDARSTEETIPENSVPIKNEPIDYDAFILSTKQHTEFEKDIYGRLYEDGLLNSLSALSYQTSQQYVGFIKSILEKDKQLESEKDTRMLCMLYYSIYKEVPENMGFSNPNDFIQYLKGYPHVCNSLIQTILPTMNIEDLEDGLESSVPLSRYNYYTKSDILAACGYWNWESSIPMREETLYVPEQGLHLIFVTLDNESTYFRDSRTLRWKAPARLKFSSTIGQKYLKITEQQTDEKVCIFIENISSYGDGKKRKLYFYLGGATYQSHIDSDSFFVYWKLDTDIPVHYRSTLIRPLPETIEDDSGEPESAEDPLLLSPAEEAIRKNLQYIILHDATQTPFKYSLLYAVLDACQTYSSYARECINRDFDKISLPLGLLVWKWIQYYYTFFSTKRFVALMKGEKADALSGKKVTMRKWFEPVVEYYNMIGGKEQLVRDINEGTVPDNVMENIRDLVLNLRQTIISNPMKHFGRSLNKTDYSVFVPEKGFSGIDKTANVDFQYIIQSCGYFSLNKDLFTYLAGRGGTTLEQDVNLFGYWRNFLIEANRGGISKDEVISLLSEALDR